MLLKGDQIIERLRPDYEPWNERLVIRPIPRFEPGDAGAASVDLRLGCWFAALRRDRITHLEISSKDSPPNRPKLSLKMHYVPFGSDFVLHPRDFILAATLEWIQMPPRLGGYVIGRSSWGRRGLVIETAAGVHPGFTGTLTLELSNVGQVPVVLRPGLKICQLFLHHLDSKSDAGDKSLFNCFRRPVLRDIREDKIAEALRNET